MNVCNDSTSSVWYTLCTCSGSVYLMLKDFLLSTLGWHDVRGSQPRFQGSTTQIHCVAAQLNKAMVAMQQNQGNKTASNGAPFLLGCVCVCVCVEHSWCSCRLKGTTPLSQKRNLKKGISKFFGQGAKFHKNLKA